MQVKKILFLCFLLGLLLTFITVYASSYKLSKDLQLLGKVIYIDPGHGGRDSGTVYANVLEKDLNLEISLALEQEFGRRGAIVYLTRDKDEDLSSIYDERKKRGDLYRRILLISDKEKSVDLYLSIHINWYDNPYWGGAEVLYHPINKNNEILGEIIMNNFQKDLGTKRILKRTNLYMYKNLNVPGVLIECGFLSNYRDRTSVQEKEYQNLIAKSITNSVVEYFDSI